MPDRDVPFGRPRVRRARRRSCGLPGRAAGAGEMIAGRAPTGSAAGAFAQDEELVRIEDDDAAAAALDQAALLPAAHDPAHGVQRAARHLGDVLAADREVECDAVVGLAPGL